MIVAVDFDGTLALGNKSHITLAEPNYDLINQLNDLKKTINPYIKIVTARGAKNNLIREEKEKKYKHLIEEFCRLYNVPYDEISFNKEYAELYIDDMTINQYDSFYGQKQDFTKNVLIFTDKTVIKKCKSSLFEKEWYKYARGIISVPEILFVNDDTIILERICNYTKPSGNDIIDILEIFKSHQIPNFNFKTYLNNLKVNIPYISNDAIKILDSLTDCEHDGTFFHGDLSTLNILKKSNSESVLIDPNYKYIFGSYLTDAGKAFFSFIAYEKQYSEAEKIYKHYGENVIKFAVAEGVRVCKYNPNYISIVNNIADLLN